MSEKNHYVEIYLLAGSCTVVEKQPSILWDTLQSFNIHLPCQLLSVSIKGNTCPMQNIGFGDATLDDISAVTNLTGHYRPDLHI